MLEECVATSLRRDEYLNSEFVANLLQNPSENFFLENRLIFGEVLGKGLASCFFDSQCTRHD